jgi:hypothetical protein
VKCDYRCLEWNVAQNLNRRLKKIFCTLKFCSLEHSFYMTEEKKVTRHWLWGVRWTWCAPQAILAQTLFHSLCDVWFAIVSSTINVIDLWRREECLSLDDHEYYKINSSTYAPWAEH